MQALQGYDKAAIGILTQSNNYQEMTSKNKQTKLD